MLTPQLFRPLPAKAMALLEKFLGGSTLGGWYVCILVYVWSVRELSGGEPGVVCPVTYADNWEVWCSRVRPLFDLLDPLAAFLRAACDAKSHFVGLMMTGVSIVFCIVLELKT